jgi:serine/threonine protein kinase/lipoprotein NlpI
MAKGVDNFDKVLAQASAVLNQAVENQTKTIILDPPKKADAADTLGGPEIRKEASVSSILKREYQPVGELGEGGMGKVSSVVEILLNREVAMKRIRRPEGSTAPLSKEAISSFLREALAMARVGHQNVPDVYEVNVDSEGNPYFTMKRIRGEDLSNIISKIECNFPGYAERFPVSRRLEIFKGICYAIACAHSKGIIHRDLKPANAMVGSEFGEVYVIDWGMAKMVGDKAGLDTGIMKALNIDTTQKTLDGIIKGTPSYMPPEQAEGRIRDIDERTDIYSLGAILYTFLSLVPPISGRTVDEVLNKVSRGQITPLNQVAPGIDARLSKVVMKALSPRKGDRYASVKEFIDMLDAYSAGVQKSVGDILNRALESLGRGHTYKAVMAIIREAKQKDPESEEALMTEAQVHKTFGKADEAIAAYKAASDAREMKTKLPHFQALFYAAETARRMSGDEKLFMGLYTRCALAGAEDKNIYSRMSEAYLLLGNSEIKRAVTILTKIVDENPSFAEAYELLGSIFAGVFHKSTVKGFPDLSAKGPKALSDIPQGIFHLTNAIENSSGARQGEYYGLRAYAHMKMGNFAKAEEDIKAGMKLNNGVDMQLVRIKLFASQKRYSDLHFLADYMIRVMEETDNPVLYYNRGVANNFERRFGEAISDLERAIELDKKEKHPFFSKAKAFYSLGVVYGKMGMLQKAIEHYGIVLEAEPNNIQALNNISDMHYRSRDYQAAVEFASKAIGVNKRYATGYYSRALASLKLWKKERNAKYFKDALDDFKLCAGLEMSANTKRRVHAHLARMYMFLAEHHISKGRKPEAAAAYGDALNLDLRDYLRRKIELEKSFIDMKIQKYSSGSGAGTG